MSATSTASFAGREPEPQPRLDSVFRFMVPTVPDLEDVISMYRRSYCGGLLTNATLVARFEHAVAERVGVRHCVAVSSCTAGLTLTFKCLGLQGEVILPAFTFFATGHAALWNGLDVVLADSDPKTWNIDPADVERKITPRTSAIVAVHLYGNPCAIETLTTIAARHGLKLIFDAAHAFGSSHDGRAIGGFGDAEVFSLSPTKMLVAGEGGLITTNDSALARRLRAARNYGDAGTYDCEVLGMNARMSEFNAALGLAGLDLVEEKVNRNNALADRYTRALQGLPGVSFQSVASHDVSTFKDYSIHIAADAFGMTRNAIMASLAADNIETRRYFYPPLNRQQLYHSLPTVARSHVPCADRISDGILSLPIYPSLEDEMADRVADAIVALAGRRNGQR